QGDDGHHRQAQGHRADRPVPAHRLSRLARLALHPHPLSDRLPQSPGGLLAVGVELRVLQARGPIDHFPRLAAAVLTLASANVARTAAITASRSSAENGLCWGE